MYTENIARLAIICAKRSELLFGIAEGKVAIAVGYDIGRKELILDLEDGAGIENLIYELNHGSLRQVTSNLGV